MRRFARFSLRSLILLTTLFALWIGLHVHGARLQKASAHAIVEHRGWVGYDYQFTDGDFDPKAESWVPRWLLESLGVDFFHSIEEVSFFTYTDDSGRLKITKTPTEIPLQPLLRGSPGIKCLRLNGPSVTNQTLKELAGFTELKSLVLANAVNISDEGVGHLKALQRLEWLVLAESLISDESLRVLGTLPRIEVLNLGKSNLSDEGLTHLSNHKKIRFLFVGGKDKQANAITDRGIASLDSIPTLALLDVTSTQVTDGGAAAFTSRHPQCKVQR